MRTHSPAAGTKGAKGLALLWAYPALRQLPPAQWSQALKRSRNTNFDAIESIGVLAGIALVTYLLQFDAYQAAALALPVRYLIQFLAAMPLLVLFVGPFYLRRTRRGLDQEIQRRHGSGASQPRR
jgi:hypothetical protein